MLILSSVTAPALAGTRAPGPAASDRTWDDAALLAEHGTVPERVGALIDRYAASGDERLLARGWELLRPALESNETDPETLLTAARLAQAGHDDDRASAYLRHAALLRPVAGRGWPLRALLVPEPGHVATVRKACGSEPPPTVLATSACEAGPAAGDCR